MFVYVLIRHLTMSQLHSVKGQIRLRYVSTLVQACWRRETNLTDAVARKKNKVDVDY